MTVHEEIMQEEAVRTVRQDKLLHRLSALGWTDARAIIDDARNHAFHHMITVLEVLDLMVMHAITGHTFEDWIGEKGRVVWEFCDS